MTSLPVLVVDDSHTVGLFVSKLLQSLGYTDIDLAQDGEAALEQLRSKHYGLILSDWEMLPMGGADFLKLLRQDTRNSKVPVILITSTTTRGASWLAGADAYLPKPFNEYDLDTAIKSVSRAGKN